MPFATASNARAGCRVHGAASRARGRRAGALGALGALLLSAPRARAATRETRDPATESAYVRELLRRSDANRARRTIELQNKYCARQRELGVGDCAGVDEDVMRDAMARSLAALEEK